MVHQDEQRLNHYDINYFTGRTCPEQMSYVLKILRPGDMGACLCYALGYTSYKQAQEVLGIPDGNPTWLPSGDHFWRQAQHIQARATRTPKFVVDIGAGRGELDAALLCLGIDTVAIDPAPGSAPLFRKTMIEWPSGVPVSPLPVNFIARGMYDGLVELASQYKLIDTIIMCESIEHIPEDEFDHAWLIAIEMLRRTSGLFIAANFINNHPIWVDGTGYDHIRAVDDILYDKMSKWAKSVVFRQGSHLVLQF